MMIIDRKKLFDALKAFQLSKEIKTKNALLNYDQAKLRRKINTTILNAECPKIKFILQVYKLMIVTFIKYYRLKIKMSAK
jgi:hypothetical protein